MTHIFLTDQNEERNANGSFFNLLISLFLKLCWFQIVGGRSVSFSRFSWPRVIAGKRLSSGNTTSRLDAEDKLHSEHGHVVNAWRKRSGVGKLKLFACIWRRSWFGLLQLQGVGCEKKLAKFLRFASYKRSSSHKIRNRWVVSTL